ncbi:MAG: hypothetical protein FWH27_06555 [Planctomycetaceae bacterium]|nr:hypothetical protein [Planctomycetaceae bacterium]
MFLQGIEPVNRGTLAFPLMSSRRDSPWVTQFIIHEMKALGQGIPKIMPVRIVDKPNKAVFELDEPMKFEKSED